LVDPNFDNNDAAPRAMVDVPSWLDESPEAVERFKKRQYRWIIDRHNQRAPEWQVLQVQVVNLIAKSGGVLVSSAEVRPGFS
jgi:hypothetical protein